MCESKILIDCLVGGEAVVLESTSVPIWMQAWRPKLRLTRPFGDSRRMPSRIEKTSSTLLLTVYPGIITYNDNWRSH
jgi:hypothetical protein